MTPDEMARRFKAAIEDLHLDDDEAAALGNALLQTAKTAKAMGIAYKAADPLDAAYQQLKAARDAGDAAAIAAALQQLATLARQPAGAITTHLSDSQKPRTKAAPLTAIQQIARATMPELYGRKRR